MFKPDSMSKVDLFIMKKDLDRVTDLLYELKLMEFFEVDKEFFNRFEDIDLNEQSSKLLRYRSAITILKRYFEKNEGTPVEKPMTKANELVEKLEKYEKDILHVKDEVRRENIVKHLKITDEEISSDSYVIGFVSKDKAKYLKEFIKKGIKHRTYKGNKRVYFVAETKEVPFQYKDFYLPKSFGKDTSEKLVKLQNSLKKVKADLKKLANSSLESLRAKEHKLSKEISIHEAKPKFSTTENIVVLHGFIPTKSVKRFYVEIERTLEDKFEMDVSEVKDDNAPTKLTNATSVGKFESLLKMYSLPKYGEFDPTILMFLVFPIFYGFILGDVIYGLISLIFFTFLKTKFHNIKDFLTILQFSSVMSIVFGIIYGEFIGFEFHGPFYGFFERSHHPETLLLFAVLLGAIHINLGLIVGFVNNIKNLKKAVCDKLSWIILEFGLGILALGVYASEETAIVVGGVFALLATILLYMGHGFIGIIEIPSFFTNILSYARLMAVGLSSIVIAMLINEYSMALFSSGVIGVVFGIVLFSLGHIFNIFLGNFESFLHTLRLHYVEFFTKFYSGDGKEFVPFGTKRYEN